MVSTKHSLIVQSNTEIYKNKNKILFPNNRQITGHEMSGYIGHPTGA